MVRGKSKWIGPFEKTIEKGIASLRTNPEKFQKKYDEVHVYFLKTFPFGIHYKIDFENRVVLIVAFFHTSRDLTNWKKEED